MHGAKIKNLEESLGCIWMACKSLWYRQHGNVHCWVLCTHLHQASSAC